jgi:predicted ferric reductase
MSKKLNKGLFFIYLNVLVVLGIWIGSKIYYGDSFDSVFKYPAKIASLSATVLMCWATILSARFRFVEKLFGGLDKVYKAHSHLGKFSFFLILLHPLFLNLRFLPNISKTVANFGFLPTTNFYNLGHNVGVLALLLMTILIGLALYSKIPYHLFKASHEYFNFVMLFIIMHILLVDSDIAKYPALGFMMYCLLTASLWSIFYIQFLYPFFGPRYKYRIKDIETTSDTLEITLSPKKKS